MNYRFEDYKISTGLTQSGLLFASIAEFASLIATGETSQEAIENLRLKYEKRVIQFKETGKSLPTPGSGKARIGFAPDDKIHELGFIVEDFWQNIIGTSFTTSFISNESQLSTWEYYCGGKDKLIRKVVQRYGIDISNIYYEPIFIVLGAIKERPDSKFRNK